MQHRAWSAVAILALSASLTACTASGTEPVAPGVTGAGGFPASSTPGAGETASATRPPDVQAWVAAYCSTMTPAGAAVPAAPNPPATGWDPVTAGAASARLVGMANLYRTAATATAAPLGGDTQSMQAWLRIASAWDAYLAGQYEQANVDLAQATTASSAAAVWAGVQHAQTVPAPRGVVNPDDVAFVHAHLDDLKRQEAELDAFVPTHPGCAAAKKLMVPAPY